MWGNHDGVSKVFPNLYEFLQHFVDAVLDAHFDQLIPEVRNYPARNLMNVLRVVVFKGSADWQFFLFCDRCELLFDRSEHRFIDSGRISQKPSVPGHAENGRLSGAVGQWGNGRVQRPDSESQRLQIDDFG